jgi:hypothetical protein
MPVPKHTRRWFRFATDERSLLASLLDRYHVGMSENHYQFSLRQRFLWTAAAAVLVWLLTGFGEAIRQAQISAERNTYGGQKYTRQQAESLAGTNLLQLRDDEFIEGE